MELLKTPIYQQQILFVHQPYKGYHLNILVMKKNMGNVDKGIRIILAVAVALLYYFNFIEGTLAYILLGGAIVFLLTSLFSFCPLYVPFGIRTCKVKK